MGNFDFFWNEPIHRAFVESEGTSVPVLNLAPLMSSPSISDWSTLNLRRYRSNPLRKIHQSRGNRTFLFEI